MGWRVRAMALGLLALLPGCQGTQMTGEQKTAAIGAAAGTGLAMVAGGSFGQVVGAGLVGGAAGYLGGHLLDGNK
ncbi:MAG TPA: hypothetical protein VHQ91_06360 [Geminicoccaceae bacterium]|jgi:hypothetical protein|nr:hypothetical protein [Geminicoccaceae bacterium]